jgi:hypothetical protein
VPDGARILTGSEGHVTAGATELGPNQEAVVRSGVLDPDPTPKVAAPPTTVTRAPVTTATTTQVTMPATTPTTAAVKPAPTTEPTAVKTDPVVTGTKDPETVTTKPAQPAEPVTLKLESVVGNGGAKLRWSAYQGRGFAAYLVLRAPAPDEPVYPVTGSTTQAGRPLTDQWTTATFDQVDKPEGQAYRVVAVDRDGRVLGISGVVRPAVPERKTTDTTTNPAASAS